MTDVLGLDTATLRIRDLSDEEFARRYDCDRFTATVLSNRFSFIIDNVVSQVCRAAFSPIVQGLDFAVTISGPATDGFPMAAVSQTLPVFIGSIPDGVRISLEEYGIDRLQPGDVIAVNDYYRVGTHLNDLCFIRPVFHDGRIVSVMTIRCHQLDMGGIRAGGFQATKVSSYEDGLVLPPILLFSAGRPVESVVKLIMNNTRFGQMLWADMKTVHACLAMGDDLIQESIAKYGCDAYLGAIRYTDDSAAETMALALEQLPDGVYDGEAGVDGDHVPGSDEYVIRLRVTKRGRRAEFDFSGTSNAARTAVNCTWLDTKTAVALALKCLVDPLGRFTSGSLRNVDLMLPPDSFINPMPPHSCQFYFEPLMTVVQAVYDALNPVLGERAVAHDGGLMFEFVTGTRPDGSEWVYIDGCGAAWGATRCGDGDSSGLPMLFNMSPLELEEEELGDPARNINLGGTFIPDSGGPGMFRGGAAMITDSYWMAPASHFTTYYHFKRSPSGGVNGGRAGLGGAGWIWDGADGSVDGRAGIPRTLDDPAYRAAKPLVGLLDAETNELNVDGVYHALESTVSSGAGSIVRLISTGAGGWGDPFTRDPDLVLRDVRDEYVSIAGAARDYGVVVVGDPVRDPEGLVLDIDATARLRSAPRPAPTGA